MAPDCDLFCSVVDNFGDIGVCWRLARALAQAHGWQVRLWVDAPQALARIKPRGAVVPGVQVMHWRDDMPACVPAPCVIEAFACALPANFVAAMARCDTPPRWINLEYLSAEDWVEGCHGLPSRDPVTGLTKHFFFPGFTARTGGLLRERDLFARRDAWRAAPHERPEESFRRLGMQPRDDALQLSLFSYESTALASLLDALRDRPRPTQLWVPEGRSLAALSGLLAQPLAAGNTAGRGALSVHALAFMDQDDYDALLWHCDANIVRGEDSFVRAQWAARPMLWQAYAQEDAAHLPKVEAFVERCAAGLDAPHAANLRILHAGLNGGATTGPLPWDAWLDSLPELTLHAAVWADQLAAQADLASQLVLFNQTPI
jgi:uncharacterized repeat protein (TIGR03837 family)